MPVAFFSVEFFCLSIFHDSRTEPVIAFKSQLTRLSICQTVLGPLHVYWGLALTGAILIARFPELWSSVAFIAPREVVHTLHRQIAMSKTEGGPLWVFFILVDATIEAIIPGKLAGVALAEELVENIADFLFTAALTFFTFLCRPL